MTNLFDSTLLDTGLFDTDGAIYMGSQRTPEHCDVGLFGVPYDGTTSFRPGTRFGPAAIRDVSSGLETYCPQFCLLYTSPSPRDLSTSRMPSSA